MPRSREKRGSNLHYLHKGNRLYQIDTSQGTFAYSYDLAGRRIGMSYPNGVTITYTYIPASYLTDLVAQKPPSTVNSFAYAHDAVGNRISKSDPMGLQTYQYDPINQLIQSLHPNIPNEQFSYDPAGNRFHAAVEEVDLLNIDTDYTYDYENRLIRVQYAGMDAQYKYDPFGRRIEKNVNGQITRYVYDGDNILNEEDGAGNIISKYVFNLAIDDPLSVEQAGSVYYYHKDGLGSVTELTNATGSVVKTYRYNSFGEIYNQTGSLFQPFTFTSREYDPEIGLYYYRARYYDPAAGVFIGKDPIGFLGGDVNLLRYVGNNPVNLIDPNGEFFNVPGAIAGGIVGGVIGGFGSILTGNSSLNTIATATIAGTISGAIGGSFDVSMGVGAGIGAGLGAASAVALGANIGGIAGAALGGGIGGALAVMPGLGTAGIAAGTWIGGLWGTAFGFLGEQMYNYFHNGNQSNPNKAPCR